MCNSQNSCTKLFESTYWVRDVAFEPSSPRNSPAFAAGRVSRFPVLPLPPASDTKAAPSFDLKACDCLELGALSSGSKS